jgi:hypothetical protein
MEKLKILAEKLGITNEDLQKLEAGEVEVDAFASQFASKYEQNVSTRLKPEIEKTLKGSIYGEAFGMTEKRAAEEFGIDLAQYEQVEKTKRLETIFKDIKSQYETKLQELQGADSKKAGEAYKQLEDANTKIKQLEQKMQAEIEKVHSEYKAKEVQQKFENKLMSLIGSVENPLLSAKVMRAALVTELQENGYSYEFGDDGKVWLTKDGVRVRNSQRPTENLTIDDFFGQIAEANSFSKKSNGKPTGGGENGNGATEIPKGIHPNAAKRLAELQNK